MNFLRKLGKWCWDKKERMVLVIMLIFLAYRVYTVINVAEADGMERMDPPISGQPDPYPPPPRPTRIVENADVTTLARRSIFDWVSPGSTGSGDDGPEGQDIKVLMIIEKLDGSLKAQISTGGKRTIVAEGDSFESYMLVSIIIDGDSECCEIYSENSRQNIIVCVE